MSNSRRPDTFWDGKPCEHAIEVRGIAGAIGWALPVGHRCDTARDVDRDGSVGEREMADAEALLRLEGREHPAVTLLRDLEWSGEDNWCPCCRTWGSFTVHTAEGPMKQGGKHRAGCRLAAILASAAPASQDVPDDRPLRERILDALERILPAGSRVTMSVTLPAAADAIDVSIGFGAPKDGER